MKTLLILLIVPMLIFCGNDDTPVGPNGDGPEINMEIEMEMVLIPAGEFEMGDNFGEGDPNELPVHTVYLDSFYIGKYEVTNAQYRVFMASGGYTNQSYWAAGGYSDFGTEPEEWRSAEWQGGGLQGNDNIPVVGVCWYEAMAFCAWFSEKTGLPYRLPTEAEWEKTARGDSAANSALGHQRKYPWGDSIQSNNTNYFQSGDTYETRGGNGGMTPVGYYDGSIRESYQTQNNSSPYGVYDMAGNVWELCLDWYGENYYANSPVNNPKGPESGTNKVMRGGSRHAGVSWIRSSFRENGTKPSTRSASMGFRLTRNKNP